MNYEQLAKDKYPRQEVFYAGYEKDGNADKRYGYQNGLQDAFKNINPEAIAKQIIVDFKFRFDEHELNHIEHCIIKHLRQIK